MIDFGEGVRLHALTREGIQVARGWRNDSEIYKWCRQSDCISDVAQERWFERQAADQSIKMYWIESVLGGERVGVCGLTSIDKDNRRAEFSLYIAPKEQKKGYARAALKTLLGHAFRNLGLHLVWGESFEGNPALKLFSALGFREEGMRREFYFKDGEWVDAHLFSILESEWKQQWRPSVDSSEPSSDLTLPPAKLRLDPDPELPPYIEPLSWLEVKPSESP